MSALTTPLEIQSPSFIDTEDGIVAQTTDATPVVIKSVPVGTNKVVGVFAYLVVYENLMTVGAILKGETAFVRITGNVTRIAAPQLTVVVNQFGAPLPSFDIVANTGTQSVDFVVTGKAGMTIRWHLKTQISATP